MVRGASEELKLEPSFFTGRLLVEIVNWDWGLHVGMSSEATPPEYRFQGGLLYSRGIEIDARVVAPTSHRGKKVRIWVSPVGSEIGFGPDGIDEVGQFREYPDQPRGRDFEATLLLPQDSLAATLTCLASVWKYLHIWTVDDPLDRASITNFCFSRDIHKNLAPWIEGQI